MSGNNIRAPHCDAEATLDSYRGERARGWDERFSKNGPKSIIPTLLSKIRSSCPKILELGCGGGTDATAIVPFCGEYLGVDASEEMLEIARERNLGAKFLRVDMRSFEYPANRDAILAFFAFVHTPPEELLSAFKKAKSSLASDGVFYLSVWRSDSSVRREVWDGKRGAREMWLYDRKTLETIAGDDFRLDFEHSGKSEQGRIWGGFLFRKK